MAALLKEAFSGLAVEMNKGFSSLGALLKVKNDAKGDDNASVLSDSESDDHDCGSDKDSEEPARKKQKTDDALVLSKDKSDILNKLEKEFNVSEQDGAEIHGNLATIVQKLLKDKPKEDKVYEIKKRYLRPKNCEMMVETRVNLAIWNNLSERARTSDLKLQKVQKSLIKGSTAVVQVLNDLISKPDTFFFFIRTSNFDAEAERSYIFWRFEAETFLKMFLNLPGIVFQPISADVTRQTIKEHFLLRYGIKLLAHTGLTCSDATCEMSRQPTLAKFGFKKRIDHRGLQQDINLLDFVAKTPKKFTCSTCSKAFINQQGLSVHVKCVHGVVAEGKILAKSSDSTPKTESENEIQTAVSSTMDKILSLVAEESSSSEKGNTNM